MTNNYVSSLSLLSSLLYLEAILISIGDRIAIKKILYPES